MIAIIFTELVINQRLRLRLKLIRSHSILLSCDWIQLLLCKGWFTRTTQTHAEWDTHAHFSIPRWRQSCSQNPRYPRPAVGNEKCVKRKNRKILPFYFVCKLIINLFHFLQQLITYSPPYCTTYRFLVPLLQPHQSMQVVCFSFSLNPA